jgi:phosphatidate phosphatase APP1
VDRQRCVMIGDSGEQDFQIYRRIRETTSFADHIDRILIRHVPGTPLQKDLMEREIFYKEINELRSQLGFILTD